MKTTRRPIPALAIAIALIAVMVSSLSAQPNWGEGRGRERMGDGRAPEPLTLSTNPDGEFAHYMQRFHEEMAAIGEQRRAIGEHVAEVRRLSYSDSPEDAAALSEQLAEMHRKAEELNQTMAESRARFIEELLPKVPAIVDEIDAELAVIDEEAPGAQLLQRIREGLIRWQENPEAMPIFDRIQERQNRFMERMREDSENTSHWLVRRLERLERRQTELIGELDRLDQQINEVRQMVDEIPPDELERITEPPARDRPSPDGQQRQWRGRP